MRESELRLECLKLAMGITYRDCNNNPDDMIALSKKLCDYVIGDAEDALLQKRIRPLLKSKAPRGQPESTA